MQKRGKLGNLTIFLLLLLVVLHTLIHFAAHGTGIKGFGEKGIYSPLIEKEKLERIYPLKPSSSSLILIIEWILIIAFTTLTYTKQKNKLSKNYSSKEEESTKEVLPKTNEEISTDLDRLYSLLKQKKRIKISDICNIFKINREIAMQWAMTFESGNLASIRYPRMGEPEIVLIEESSEDKNEKK